MEGACCVFVIGLPLVLLFGSFLVLLGCALYNRLAGGRRSPFAVPRPELGQAMWICFFGTVGHAASAIVLAAILVPLALGEGAPANMRDNFVTLHLLPLGIICLGAAVALTLPTSFPRGLLVALCVGLILLGIAAVPGLIALLAHLGSP